MGKGSLMFLLPTGGEPFLRKDIGEIVKIFHKNTGVRNVGIPTNGSTTARTVSIVKDLCESCPDLDLHIDVSLDGVGELHDEIRVFPGLFKRSIETYKALREIEKHYKNFSVQVETTVSKHNEDVLIENYEWFRKNLDVDTVFTLLTRGSPKEPLAKFFDVEKYQAYADHMEKEYKSGSLSGYDHFPFADFINAKRIVRHNLIAKIARENEYQIPVLRREPRRRDVRERRHLPVRAAHRPQARQRARGGLRLPEDLVQRGRGGVAQVHPRVEVLLHLRVLPHHQHPLQSAHDAGRPEGMVEPQDAQGVAQAHGQAAGARHARHLRNRRQHHGHRRLSASARFPGGPHVPRQAHLRRHPVPQRGGGRPRHHRADAADRRRGASWSTTPPPTAPRRSRASLGARVVFEGRKGYGRAYKTGFENARGDIIVTMDGDGTYPPNSIPLLLHVLLEEKIDFMTARRWRSKNDKSKSPLRLLGNAILSSATMVLFRRFLIDSQSGHVDLPARHPAAHPAGERRHGALAGDQDPGLHPPRDPLPRDADLLRRARRREQAQPLARRLRQPGRARKAAADARAAAPRVGHRHAVARGANSRSRNAGPRRPPDAMALCLAHATAGYLAYEALRPAGPHRPGLLAGAVLLANAPDLDFVPGLVVGASRRVPPRRDAHAGRRRGGRRRGVGDGALAASRAPGLVGVLRRRRVRQPPARRLDDGRCRPAATASRCSGRSAMPGCTRRSTCSGRSSSIRRVGSAFVRSLLTPTALLAWAREVGIARGGDRERACSLRAARGALAGPVADESLEP